MPRLPDYPTLHYFMQCYWNQMGDVVHGSFTNAVSEFCSSENEAHRRSLFQELVSADEAGMIPDQIDWTNGRYAAFWEDRILTKSDLAEAQIELAKADPIQ